MRFHVCSGARSAPIMTTTAHRSAKLAARMRLPAATSAALAELAFGTRYRDHTAMLAGLVADRTSSAGAGR